MAGLFEDLIPKEGKVKIPNNIEVNTGIFSDLLPTEEKQKFKLSTKGNPGSNLTTEDFTEPGLFDDLNPENKKPEDIDGDMDLWEKVRFAAGLGFKDTYRGGKQILGFDQKQMKADQKKLYEYMENPDGSTNWAVAGAYFGSAILDPAGWLIPVTKARTLYKAAKYGFVSAGIVGGLGYVDEESLLDTRTKQAGVSAIGGTILSPIITGVAKKVKGEKVFTRESLGIPGFDSPTVKVKSDSELQKIKLQNEAGKKFRDAESRKKIEIDEPETIKDMPADRAKLLRGPRLWFRENIVKPYEKKFGKPALNYLTNGEYGAEAATGSVGGLYGYASAESDAPITTKFGRAFTGALIGAAGIKGARMKTYTKTFGKGEDVTEEVSESLLDLLGRNFVDGYGLPKNFKSLQAESQGFANHIAMKFTYMANKIQKNLTADEQKILINLIEGDTKLKVAPTVLKDLSKESRKLINEMAQDYVDMGLISVKTFERNKDIYIKRSYVGKLDKRPFAEELKNRGATQSVTLKEFDEVYKKQKAYTTTSQKQKKDGIFIDVEGPKKLLKNHRGWELADSSKIEIKKINDPFDTKIKATKSKKKKAELIAAKKKATEDLQVNIRWEYTKPQRVGLGEIEDAAFAIAETGRAGSRTLSQYRFYDNISKQSYVYDTFAKVPKDLRKTYKQIPTTLLGKTSEKKRYGNLAGKYVPEEVYKNLVAASAYYRKETADGFYKKYRSLNSYWKVSKTAWNPTVHVNNIMSNFVLHDLVDADFKFLLPAYRALTKHNKADKFGKIQRSQLVEAATKHGVFDADLITTELKNIQAGSRFPYKMDDALDPASNSVNAARKIFDDVAKKDKFGLTKLTDWYRFEDAVFRLSVFQDRLSKGWKIQDAALDARKSFVDYNIDAPAINWMRNTITPFLAYTYRIIPILGETAILRPWKYAKYAALGYGLNQMGNVVGGGDEEAERAVMPERKQGKFLNMDFLPYRNIKIPFPPGKDKAPYYMDFTRFVPGGDILDLNGTLPGVPAPLQPSGGLAGEVLFPLAGWDLFRQEKIKGLTGITGEDWEVKGKTILSKLIPNIPLIPGGLSTKKIESTRKGMESPFRPDQTEFVSIAQSLGFKIEKAQMDKLTAGKAFELKRKIKGYKEQISVLRSRYIKGLISEETYEEKATKIGNKIQELAEKYQVKFDKAMYSVPKKALFSKEKK